MTVYNDGPANIAALVRELGLEPSVARAWLRAEGQSVPNRTNPLNILAGGLTANMQTGSSGRFATFVSPAAGIRAAGTIIRSLAPRYGYGAILTATKGSDPIAQARAIERSGWAAGRYGSRAGVDGLVTRLTRQYPPVETPDVSTTPIVIVAGTPFFAHEADSTSIGSLTSDYTLTPTRRSGSRVLGTISVWIDDPGSIS